MAKLLALLILISFQSAVAQIAELQFEQPLITDIEEIEKAFNGKLFTSSVIVYGIPRIPTISYQRESKPHSTFVDYQISQESVVENVRYSKMASLKDSTLIRTLYERDLKAITDKAGSIVHSTSYNSELNTHYNWWDRPGLHIRLFISMLKESNIAQYQVVISWVN